MSRFAALAKAFILSCFLGLTVPAWGGAQTPSETAKELTKLHEEWAQARIHGDVQFLEKFYGKELKLNVVNGSVVDRKDDIALFASRSIRPEFIVDEDLKVSVYGETAVVTGVEHLKGTYKGNPGEFRSRFLNVFVFREQRWQLVAAQGTEVRSK